MCRTYTYNVRAMAAGNLTNKVQLLYADINPSNDNSTALVQVLATCGNPIGNNTSLACGSGSIYSGNDNLTLSDPSQFQDLCCVSIAKKLDG